MNMTLGEKIRKARKGKMTQAELAEAIGVHEMTIRRWELGERRPDVGALQKISNVLSVPVIELIDDPSNIEQTKKSSIINNVESENKIGLGYWGSVVDNARRVASLGNYEDMFDVSELLKRAQASLNVAMAAAAPV